MKRYFIHQINLVQITPPLADAKKWGHFAYYAPWGNVVMFYKDFGSASGLYELGSVDSGIEDINNLSGILEIKKSRLIIK